MVEGAMRHDTTMEVEGNDVDSHGQSEIGFGITRLLGFDPATPHQADQQGAVVPAGRLRTRRLPVGADAVPPVGGRRIWVG